MDSDEIKTVIRDFLGLLENDEISVEEAEARLPAVLDRLALAQAYVSFTFDETDYPESPEQSHDHLLALISSRFPNYRYYNVAENITTDIGNSGTVVGDAIDDLADIARDLYEVEWCWSNTSEADALWHFKYVFNYHWRQHLRSLQLYLDAHEQGS